MGISEPIDPNNQQKLNCKMMGGTRQLKYQLAQISRHEVEMFPKLTLEIIHISNQSLLDMGKKKNAIEFMRFEIIVGAVTRFGVAGSESFSLTSPSFTLPSSISSFFFFRESQHEHNLLLG